MSISDDLNAEQVIADLRRSNERLSRENVALKLRQSELTEAVYRAAKDAASGLALPPVKPVKKDRRDQPTSETAIAVLSDWQLAKVTPSYDSMMCEIRIGLYAKKLKELVDIQRTHHPVRDLRVYLLGDIVEGELIFPGQSHLIDSSLYRQVMSDGPRILGNFLREMCAHFENVHVVGVIGNHGCGTTSMRAVTNKGLKRWDEIHEGDLVLSMSDDGTRCWQPVEEVVSYIHDGPMIDIANRDVRFRVTPDHRVVGHNVNTDGWGEWTADSMPHMLKLPVAAKNSQQDTPHTDEEIRLVAWCLTDSHREKHGYWRFYQRLSKADRIEALLAGYNYRRSERARDIQIIDGNPLKKKPETSVEFFVSAEDSRRITELVQDRDRLPAWVWSLSRRQVSILLEEWIYTDGTRPNGKAVCIYVSREQLREDLQLLLTANGYRTTATEYRPGHWRLNVSDTTITHVTKKTAVTTSHYSGIAWCLRVPNGRFFAEENGRVFLTGNSLGGRSRREYHPESNADAMCYEVTRLVLEHQPNLTWAPNSTPGERHWYAIDQVGDRRFFLFHGDQVKGGFAGFPWYGFGKKLQGWHMINETFDYALSGHFHTPVRMYQNGITLWGNGSTESDNTYAAEQLAASGEPCQWLLFSHPRRGVTAEYLVKLT